MAKNIVYKPGDHLPAPVAAGTKSGDALQLGGLNAVAITDRANTSTGPINADGTVNTNYNPGGSNDQGNASVWFEGVVNMKVTAAAAPAFGAPVYFDPAGAATKLTVTAGALIKWGNAVSLAPVNNGDGTYQVLVRIAN